MAYLLRNIHVSANLSRNEQKKAVVEEFLKEAPGTGKGRLTSRYRYDVETLSSGSIIYLTRPARKKYGFDFIIHVENMTFSNGRDNPSFDDIFKDLRMKKTSSNSYYQILYGAIKDVYNCIDPNDVLVDITQPNNNVGFSYEMILKVVKWFFIEQDIRYWNLSGRNMLMDAVNKI